MPQHLSRDGYTQERRYAIGGAALIYCCCFLLVVGLAIALGVTASANCPAPPPITEFGSCCINSNNTVGNACFDHTTNDTCNALESTTTFAPSTRQFTPGGICNQILCATDISTVCLSVLFTSSGDITCTGRITDDGRDSLVDELESNQTAVYTNSQCDVRTGCCGPTSSK